MGCNAETLATFRQFQADGGFAIPTSDLAAYNALLDAGSTGLLMHEHETQVLHGLWKSTRVDDAGAEVRPGYTQHISTCRTPLVYTFSKTYRHHVYARHHACTAIP